VTRRVPVRLRLTLAFTVAIGLVLAATALFLYLRLRTELDGKIDARLNSRMESVAAKLEGAPASLARAREVAREEETTGFVQILVPGAGTVVGSRGGLDGGPILEISDLARIAEDGGTYDLQADEPLLGSVRVLPETVRASPGRYIVAVGETLNDRNETLDNVRTLLVVGGPAALLLAGLIGWVVIGAALRPVDRMLARLEQGLERERTFVADASHELRTPLTMLKVELELMRRERPTGADLDEALAGAIGDADRLTALSEDLLALARADRDAASAEREAVDPRELLDAVAARYPGGRVAVGEVATSGTPTIDADRVGLERALANLVDNALRYGAPPVTLSATVDAERAELHVTDAGPGFPADFLPTAFERFSQAASDKGGEGTGLGLAIVAAIAASHGGTAGAANASGGGADVWIRIPARPGRAAGA
jgi:two-component system, OmpR family, sensor kinase